MEFKKLFEPIYINKMKLKNRIVMPPMHTRFASESGETTDRVIEFYVERAKGGVGLIIIENTCIDWLVGRASGNPLRIDQDIYTCGLRDLVEAVHKYDTKIASQPHHSGRQNTRANIEGGRSPIAPSSIPCGLCKDIPDEMTIEDIKKVIDQFVAAARRTKQAGFDAVELHAAHGYIITQFMSPYTNKRNDLYGGSLENRMRFPIEIVRRVREEIGPDFPIIYRFSADEKVPGGLQLEESLCLVKRLEKEGVDAFHVSAGIYESITWIYPDDPGVLVYLAEAVKKEVKVPVITVGRLGNPIDAEKVLKEGRADLVSMGRSLLADPYIPLKTKMGKTEDICPCIACNECVGRLFSGWRLGCTVNPLLSKEYKIKISKAQSPKKVLIIGAGPAGLEAARVATLSGHKVELFDKREKIGGQLQEASVAKFKEEHLKPLIIYYENQLSKLKIDVKLGKEMKAEEIINNKPDVVIVATGSMPIIPDITGIKNGNVYLAVDFLSSEQKVASKDSNKNIMNIGTNKKICVIGGGEVGLETALVLEKKGYKVTVIEITNKIAKDLNSVQIEYMNKRLKDSNILILKNHRVMEIKEGKVLIENTTKFEISEIECDIVFIAVGFKPNNNLSMQLEGKVPEVKAVGDCVNVGRLFNAIHNGFTAAYQISEEIIL